MTLHISETPANVQMLPASPIDLAAENAVSNPSPVRTARCRDMSKLNQLIAAHELSIKERGIALDAMEVAEIKQYDLGGAYAKVRIGAGFPGVDQITVSELEGSRADGIKAIHEYYGKLEKGHGFFGNMENYLNRLAVQKADALKRLHDACDKIDAAVKESGLDVAKMEIGRTYKNEDAALCDLLAYRAETPEECSRKSDYLRSTFWFQEVKTDETYFQDQHLEAMMQGMGCGVAS